MQTGESSATTTTATTTTLQNICRREKKVS